MHKVFHWLICLLIPMAPVVAAEQSLEALEEQAFKHAVALVDPSIVRIETVGGLEQVDEVLVANGPTTGVVVTADGFIVTSTFNFLAKPTSILVTLPDGRRLAARQIASDRLRLLTLLKIDAEGLTPALPAPRNEIKVGQWALAVGRTLDNASPSVSVGIVSAIHRVWGKAIQTDAKTSPVNYGGGLIDVDGRFLGVIAPMSPMATDETAGVEWYDGGIGFAIPMEDVYAALDRLKQGSDLLPGLMGINFAGGQALNVPPIVDRVRYNSPAQLAGLKMNDRIVEVDGEKIVRVAQFRQRLGSKYAGDTVKLGLQRGDESLTKEIALVGQLVPYEFPFLGILPVRASVTDGVAVRFVIAKSPAEQAGLQRGDVIVDFNRTAVKQRDDLLEVLNRSRPGDRVTLTYRRDEQRQTADVTLSTLPEDVIPDLPADLSHAAADAPAGDSGPATEKNTPEKETSAAKRGRFNDKLEGHDHDFWAYVPEQNAGDAPNGLVVWIHPAGDFMEAILKEWKPLCDRRGLILVGPKAEMPAGWQPGESEFVVALIEHLRERYKIDPNRIVIHGHGSGAPMACLVSTRHRELIRGIVVTGAPFIGQMPESEPDYRQQFYFLCGEANKLLPRVKAAVAALRKLKFPVTLRTVGGLDEKYPPENDVEEIGRWVDSLDRI